MPKSSIHELNAFGQSVWLDNISRFMIRTGKLKGMTELGLRGMTSNPTIFDKAISSSTDYDEKIVDLCEAGKSTFEIYDDLTVRDVQEAADIFLPVYKESNGLDGYVSLEINPRLAYKTEETIKEGKRLCQKLNRPNVMFKVPATQPGFCAIEELVALGININSTLIFSLEQYINTANAYNRGIKRILQNKGDVNKVRSVASIFVSRIDTSVDNLLDQLLAKEQGQKKKAPLLSLKGKAAVGNSGLIYQKYSELFSSGDFKQLQKKGAHLQRVLWGSTSTKNPDYSDIKYVSELIAKNTVNTMPEQTFDAFLDHGKVKEALTSDASEAQKIIAALKKLGIDINDVCEQLLKDGVLAFEQSFDSLLNSIEKKKNIVCKRWKMRNDLTIKIAGEAGQGMQTIGIALCKLFKRVGLNIFSHQDVMSRIRGGNNFTQVRISHKPLYTLRNLNDIVVALDRASVTLHRQSMTSDGLLILDRKTFKITDEDNAFFDVPLYDMAKNVGGSELFINSAAFGILAGLTRLEFHNVAEVLKYIFSDKSEDIIKKNIETAKAGYNFSKDNFKPDTFAIETGTFKQGLLMNGHDAVSLGAIRAGCKFYSGYPMSPSTPIMNNIANYAKDFNIVVEQAEDEIAAINMILGASFAGVRSMCATSGGGFALMIEGLSLSGMTETPIVVVDAQRPAPATGFPTRTEQADLDYLIHAGHGEFARAVFSPGTIEQAFYLTVRAFNLAEKYQIPVLIMTDQHLAESHRNIEMFDLDKAKVKRFIISKEDSKK